MELCLSFFFFFLFLTGFLSPRWSLDCLVVEDLVDAVDDDGLLAWLDWFSEVVAWVGTFLTRTGKEDGIITGNSPLVLVFFPDDQTAIGCGNLKPPAPAQDC